MSCHGTHVVVMEIPEGSWDLRHTHWALQAPFYLIRFSVGYFALAQGNPWRISSETLAPENIVTRGDFGQRPGGLNRDGLLTREGR
jgi:hypothetical protein